MVSLLFLLFSCQAMTVTKVGSLSAYGLPGPVWPRLWRRAVAFLCLPAACPRQLGQMSSNSGMTSNRVFGNGKIKLFVVWLGPNLLTWYFTALVAKITLASANRLHRGSARPVATHALDLRSALHTLYSRASISLPCKFYVRSLVSSYIFILFHRTAN